jgi:hypothetical protein
VRWHRALPPVVVIVASGCGAVANTADDKPDGETSDAGRDAAAVTDGGWYGEDAAPSRQCSEFPAFLDTFNRITERPDVGWDAFVQRGAMLSIDGDSTSPTAGFLRIDVEARPQPRNGYLTKKLPAAACRLGVSLKFRPTALAKKLTLFRADYTDGSHLELRFLDDRTLELRETDDATPARSHEKTVANLATNETHSIGMYINLASGELNCALVPQDTANVVNVSLPLIYTHGTTERVHVGAIDVPPGDAFTFYVDDFYVR